MTARTPTYLKSIFESGDLPSGQDYSDVFDSFLPILASGKQSIVAPYEFTQDVSVANLWVTSALNVNSLSSNIIDVTTVSASVGIFNRINANVVSASGGLFNVIEANKVSASAGFFNLLTSQQVSASVVNANIINAQSVSASAYRVAGTKVVGTQQTAVVQASGGVTVDAEARTALNDLITRLRTHGLIAS